MRGRGVLTSLALSALLAAGSAGADSFSNPTDDLGVLGSTPQTGVNWNWGDFTDYLNFSVAPASQVSGTFNDIELSLGRYDVLDIQHFDVDLYQLIDGQWGLKSTFIVDLGSGDSQSFTRSLSAGNYSFKVSGEAEGILGGKYSYSISAVPEPTEWALMLSGLGLLVAIGRRRNG